MFRLASLNSSLTDGVYGSLRHGRLYFLACLSVLARSRPRMGGRHFTVQGWLSPVLVLGETCLGNCMGTEFLPWANQTAGPLVGRRRTACPDAEAGMPCSLPRGRETGPVRPLLATVPGFCPGWAALRGTFNGQDKLSPGRGLDPSPSWTHSSVVCYLNALDLVPSRCSQTFDKPGKAAGAVGAVVTLQEKGWCLPPSQGCLGRRGRSQKLQNPQAPKRTPGTSKAKPTTGKAQCSQHRDPSLMGALCA